MNMNSTQDRRRIRFNRFPSGGSRGVPYHIGIVQILLVPPGGTQLSIPQPPQTRRNGIGSNLLFRKSSIIPGNETHVFRIC